MAHDDDAKPIGFEQDEESDDFGDGYFVYSDGSRRYSSDPETAKALDQQGKASVGTSSKPKLDDVIDMDEPAAAAPTSGVKTAPPTEEETAGLTPSAEDLAPLETPTRTPPTDDLVQRFDAQHPAPKGDQTSDLVQRSDAQHPAPRGDQRELLDQRIQIPDGSRIAKSHNNPGNLKYAGQAGATEGEPAKGGGHWARFETPEAGYEAIRKQIDSDAATGMSVRSFIEKYAPKDDGNDTEAYVAAAAKTLGVDPASPLGEADRGKLQRFVAKKESSTTVEDFRGTPYAPNQTAPRGLESSAPGPYAEGQKPPATDAEIAAARAKGSERALAAAAAPDLPKAEEQQQDTQGESAQQTQSLNTGATVSRTGSAVPEEQFLASQAALGGAYDRAIEGADDSRFGEAGALLNRQAQLEQMGRDRETAAAAAQAQNTARKQAVQKKIGEVSARPTDVNKIWKDKGPLGTILGAIGVFLGGVSAYTTGRENSALRAIQEQKKQAIDAQLEDRNSELRGLERELGSLDAAVPVFEARMNQAIQYRLDAQLAGEKSQTVLNNGRQLKSQLEIEKQAKLRDGAQAYYGTLAEQQSRSAAQQATEGTQGSRSYSTASKANAFMPDVQLKQAEAQRDLEYMQRSGLKADEYRKEQQEYGQKAMKVNALRSSLDNVAKTLGVSVTKNDDGSVTVSGKPDVGILPSADKRRVDSAYAELKSAQVENMTREPAKDLVSDFTELTERPFHDDEIVPKLQRLYDIQGHLQDELDGGYNPVVVQSYKDNAHIREKKPAVKVTGPIPAQAAAR